MEIDAIYVMGTARKYFRLHELLAKLEEQFGVDTVQCAVIRNDYTVDMRVVFSDPAKVKAGVSESIGVDDKGYSWVRFVNPAWMGIHDEPDRWYIVYKREPFINRQGVLELQHELLAEIEATA